MANMTRLTICGASFAVAVVMLVFVTEKALICREAVIKSVGIMMGIEDHQEKNIIRRLL